MSRQLFLIQIGIYGVLEGHGTALCCSDAQIAVLVIGRQLGGADQDLVDVNGTSAVQHYHLHMIVLLIHGKSITVVAGNGGESVRAAEIENLGFASIVPIQLEDEGFLRRGAFLCTEDQICHVTGVEGQITLQGEVPFRFSFADGKTVVFVDAGKGHALLAVGDAGGLVGGGAQPLQIGVPTAIACQCSQRCGGKQCDRR